MVNTLKVCFRKLLKIIFTGVFIVLRSLWYPYHYLRLPTLFVGKIFES